MQFVLAGLVFVFCFSGCRKKPREPQSLFKAGDIDPVGLNGTQRRLLFAQIIDEPRFVEECAILEGNAYKYFLKLASHYKEEKLVDKEDKSIKPSELQEENADRYRGHVMAVRNAVVIEVAEAQLTTEYGLPGYTVLPALLVDEMHNLYELRIICPPGSDLYEKLRKGIEEDAAPVMRFTGFFMKFHAKLTDKAGEPPWHRPLLIGPEPTFRRGPGSKYPVISDLRDAKMLHYLPSHRIDGPRAEERLIVELTRNASREPSIAIEGRSAAPDDLTFLKAALDRLIQRLPENQRTDPSVVVLLRPDAPRMELPALNRRISALGVRRLYVKDESVTLLDLSE